VPAGVNVVPLVGHNTARITAMAYEERDPKRRNWKNETDHPRRHAGGRVGMSDGLFYAPANHSKTEEVIELAKIVAQFHGFYTAHVRTTRTTMSVRWRGR